MTTENPQTKAVGEDTPEWLKDKVQLALSAAARSLHTTAGLEKIGEELMEHIKLAAPSLVNRPYLGLATTKEMLDELASRADVAVTAGETWPGYRTANP